MSHAHDSLTVWAVEGRFQQIIYSPKGAIEGLLIDTDEVTTQFVTDPNDGSVARLLLGLRPGQKLVVEGCEADASAKGEPSHTVYAFERLASIDGHEIARVGPPGETRGKVARLNYARHGAPNGVILDNGDFVHTKPHGFALLGLQVGDQVVAEGEARPLATGTGNVIEASRVNGRAVGP